RPADNSAPPVPRAGILRRSRTAQSRRPERENDNENRTADKHRSTADATAASVNARPATASLRWSRAMFREFRAQRLLLLAFSAAPCRGAVSNDSGREFFPAVNHSVPLRRFRVLMVEQKDEKRIAPLLTHPDPTPR